MVPHLVSELPWYAPYTFLALALALALVGALLGALIFATEAALSFIWRKFPCLTQ